MRGTPAFVLSGLILRRIFDHNQLEFTKARPETIPTIAVVEEAQSVLGHARGGDEGPYVTWVKEGRKYDLGAVLITQQPGSIAPELLSQGDNWFIFHLLSSGDLHALKSANAHFSDDLLSSLLNEPLVGQGIFWSSAGGKSYPLPIRALSFEATYKALDPEYNKAEVATYAKKLRGEFDQMLVRVQREAEQALAGPGPVTTGGAAEVENEASVDEPVDFLETCARAAIAGLKQEKKLLDDIRARGTPWMGVQVALTKSLPTQLDNREEIAYRLVVRAMTEVFGPQNEKWRTEKRPSKSKPNTTTTYVVLM